MSRKRDSFPVACAAALGLTAIYALLTYYTACAFVCVARALLIPGTAFPASRLWAPAAASVFYRVTDRGRCVPELFSAKARHIPKGSPDRVRFRRLRRLMKWVSRAYGVALDVVVLLSALLMLYQYVCAR